jgi:hypothetical protein
MTASLSPSPKLQFFDNAGAPLVGGKLYSYAAGTTTPLATYTNYGGGTANTNPIILDSRGEANVWLSTAMYKFALYTAADVLVWTVDNLSSDSVSLTGAVTSVGNVTSLGSFTSANLAAALTDETGTGKAVFWSSPTLYTPTLNSPQLGTPASGVMTNVTGLPLTTGVTGTLPVANGGTGATSLTANNVILGNGTSAVQVVAPGTSGNVLASNGTTWQSVAPVTNVSATVFTASGTFTIPTGVTRVKMTIVGGGGGGGSGSGGCPGTNGSGGGGGGAAIKWLTGLTPANTLTVTVGAAGAVATVGGTSSVASGTQTITTVSATGGAAGTSSGTGSAGGLGSSGDLNIGGSAGGNSSYTLSGGASILGGGGNLAAGRSYGGGGSGGAGGIGYAGAAGVVIFEY